MIPNTCAQYYDLRPTWSEERGFEKNKPLVWEMSRYSNLANGFPSMEQMDEWGNKGIPLAHGMRATTGLNKRTSRLLSGLYPGLMTMTMEKQQEMPMRPPTVMWPAQRGFVRDTYWKRTNPAMESCEFHLFLCVQLVRKAVLGSCMHV